MPAREAFQLFRIAQEAAANACKHAQPKNLSVTLAERHGAFELHVRDDGCGFDSANLPDSGMGLYNMQQRARAIGAELHIESKRGSGTTISCILPKPAAT